MCTATSGRYRDLVRCLEAERVLLTARITKTTEAAANGDQAGPRDFADCAQSLTEADLVHITAREARSRLAAVEGRLANIKAGTYGVCVACGKEIPEERLQAVPTATRCLACQKVQDDGNKRKRH